MEQNSENLAHCGIVLCFYDSVYLKKMQQHITFSSTYIDFFHWQIINSQIFIPWYKVAKRPR